MPAGLHFGLPSSEVDLIISLGPAIDVVQMPNSRQPPAFFTAFVTGLQDAPAVIRQGGETFGLHVFIKPLGVNAVLGVPSIEVASWVVNLLDIWGNTAQDLIGAFIARLSPPNRPPEIYWAWQRLATAYGSVPIEQLADEVGFSRRHFGERFRDYIGVPPKAAARIFRFQRACRLIADKASSLAHVALACGYYDQAHLTREWHALAGCSPRAWIARELPFLQDYEIGGWDNEPDESASLYQPVVQRRV